MLAFEFGGHLSVYGTQYVPQHLTWETQAASGSSTHWISSERHTITVFSIISFCSFWYTFPFAAPSSPKQQQHILRSFCALFHHHHLFYLSCLRDAILSSSPSACSFYFFPVISVFISVSSYLVVLVASCHANVKVSVCTLHTKHSGLPM